MLQNRSGVVHLNLGIICNQLDELFELSLGDDLTFLQDGPLSNLVGNRFFGVCGNILNRLD